VKDTLVAAIGMIKSEIRDGLMFTDDRIPESSSGFVFVVGDADEAVT
jgi:hypothetical protein